MSRRLLTGASIVFAPCLFACGGELQADVDILPHRYPNRLEAGAEFVGAVVFHPVEGGAAPSNARAVARSSALGAEVGEAGVPPGDVTGDVAFRDMDGDGSTDAVARFAVADLRAAGLLGSHEHGLEVRIEGDTTTWVGRDRIFDSDAALVVLPEPSGPFAVGTAALLTHDASRPGNTPDGRGLLLRLWYPAAASSKQPAPYFLDAGRAERNLRASYVPLPPDLFERTHAFARQNVAPAGAEPRPVLLLSTGWGAPIEEYSALAEDLASFGYLVVGINHPNGSGAVVYPDGSEPSLDPASINPDEGNNVEWARDLERVAAWLTDNAAEDVALASIDPAAVGPVTAALEQLDADRVAALGHSFGGSAALRADAESDVIQAAADLDGSVLGDASSLGRQARALLLTSPGHSSFDTSVDAFLSAAGDRARGYQIAGTEYANYADTSWLFPQALAVAPDLQPAGYQLGPIPPERAHAIVTTYLRAFFEAALDGAPAPLLEQPSPDFPEVSSRTSL
jgi:predicted dienelactone hydrolase